MRIYNPSLGKFLSVDPLRAEYPELSTYQFASNSPIVAIDRDGEELELYESNLETCAALRNGTMEELTEKRYREGIGMATVVVAVVRCIYKRLVRKDARHLQRWRNGW